MPARDGSNATINGKDVYIVSDSDTLTEDARRAPVESTISIALVASFEDLTLPHAGGTILVTSITGWSPAQWNTRVLPVEATKCSG